MKDARQVSLFSPGHVARLLEDSTGPAFDTEDLTLALGDGSTIRHYRVRISAIGDLRRVLATLIPTDDQVTAQTVRGVVVLLRIPNRLPLAPSLREASTFFHDIAGARVHLVIAASKLPASEASIELNLWVTPSEPNR